MKVLQARPYKEGDPLPDYPEEKVAEEVPLADIMDPIVDYYLATRANELVAYPPVKLPYDKKNTKVAIVGLAGTTRGFAPYNDPTWDIWTCHMGPALLPRYDLSFESHEKEEFEKPQYADKQYADLLKGGKPPWDKPVYMRQHYEDIPNSVPYPLQKFTDQFGRYSSNSICYLQMLAINQRYEEVALYGVEMEAGTEYVDQARGVVYYIGLAVGMGIKMYLPPVSQLMKCRWMYGFETDQKDQDCQRIERAKSELEMQTKAMIENVNGLQATVLRLEGAIQTLEDEVTNPVAYGLPGDSKDVLVAKISGIQQQLVGARGATEQQQIQIWKSQGAMEGFDIANRRVLQAD